MGSLFGQKDSSSGQRTMDPLMQGVMERVLGDATGLLDQGVPGTPGYFPGQNYVGMAGDTMSGVNALRDRSGGSDTENALRGYINSSLGRDQIGLGGAEDAANLIAGGAQAGQDTLSQIAGGVDPRLTTAFAMGGGTPYDEALTSAASGQVNPLTSQMFQQAMGDLTERFQEDVIPGITSSFVSAGRTGSGAHQRALTDAAGELADAGAGLGANMFGSASENALSRQLAAGQAGLSDDVSRRALAGNLFDNAAGRQLAAGQSLQSGALGGAGALGNLFNSVAGEQQGIAGMVPAMSGLDYQNINALLQGGALTEGAQGRQIAGDTERYNYEADRPYQDFQRQMGALGNVAGMGAILSPFGSEEGSSKAAGKGKGG